MAGGTKGETPRKAKDDTEEDELTRWGRERKEELARKERERAVRIEDMNRESEEAKIREAFKKFMAEEQGKNAADVDKMFDEWKNKKEKI